MMPIRPIRYLSLLILFLSIQSALYAGQISQDKLNSIALGMKKDDVVAVLGMPNSAQAQGLNADGKKVEVLEYEVAGMMDFPDEGYMVDARTLGKTYSADRPQPPPKHQGSKGYACTLVIIDDKLMRVEKKI